MRLLNLALEPRKTPLNEIWLVGPAGQLAKFRCLCFVRSKPNPDSEVCLHIQRTLEEVEVKAHKLLRFPLLDSGSIEVRKIGLDPSSNVDYKVQWLIFLFITFVKKKTHISILINSQPEEESSLHTCVSDESNIQKGNMPEPKKEKCENQRRKIINDVYRIKNE